MVRVWKVLRFCNGNTLNTLCLLSILVAVVYIITRSIEFNNSSQNNCTYYEPIDIVYTWVNGSDHMFIDQMNKYLKLGTEDVDSARHRYEDKHELRFSLRSIEKYIPWFNHIYLVTNGQIPYWLNLDYEKISVITHDDIFRDKSHLPTFSSPAIESNLHRIPGLTKRFIYFNDDIFVGQPVYLDDFYTVNKGYSVFLAYALPSCARNCPWLYVGDGQCDVGCNNIGCQFDGGDCKEKEIDRKIYTEAVNSQETPDSHNNRVNKELEALRNKVQSLFKSDYQKISLNSTNTSNIIELNNDGSIKNKFNDSMHMSYDGNSIQQHVNIFISKFVEEHNKKIIVRNRKMTRRKRSSLKEGDSVNRPTYRSSKHIDGFLESLLYTQRLFNKKYGFKPRYVPAHAPFFLDRDILQGLEYTFPTEFEITERNRFRHKDDMQFGFSYYYFLMSETAKKSIECIFDDFDTDNSGTWSDREIRNILTKIYELPLSYEIVDHFEDILLNCSVLRKYPEASTPPYERYIDSRLPTISKEIVTHCPFLRDFLQGRFGRIPKYKFHVVRDAEKNYATFRMLVSNITNVVTQLDEIRSKVTKFVCLNDNLDESKSRENELVKAVLYDFYLSLFPQPSKFELPEHSRNRFLHMSDLEDWRRRHFVTKLVLCLAIISLVFITFFNVLKKGCCKMFNKLFC